MARNLMFCESSKKNIHLNESEGKSQRYILEGEFASLDGTPNRNGRIYTKDEYLKHLEYLRKDLKAGVPLLGELDHPDDRFEVKLKEASHRILDIWYDSRSNSIQGKIELLDTPNGKLAKSLVDDNVPLHISSRAAGSVNSDNTVSIQQIYTYDLVAKPGFANAVLHRVNESEETNKYTEDVNNFLRKSAIMESKNAAPQFGFLNENVSIMEINSDIKLRKEAKEIQNNMNRVNEESIDNPFFTFDKWFDIIFDGISDGNISGTAQCGDADVPFDEIFGYAEKLYKIDFSKNEEIKEIVSKAYRDIICNHPEVMHANECDSPEICNECGKPVKECKCKHVSECGVMEGDDDDDNDDEDKKEHEGVVINKIEGEFDESDNEIKDIEAEFTDDSDDDNSDSEGKDDDSNECEKTVECGDTADKNEPEATKKNKLFDEKKPEGEKDIKDIDDRIAAIRKKIADNASVKESAMAQFPMLVNLNESNFAAFMGLTESQKNNVIAYLRDNNIYSVESINESWKSGIGYQPVENVWLKYAPDDYRKLYENASDDVKKSIKATADFLLFENQSDVNNFWMNSGLMEHEAKQMNNDAFINAMPKITSINESEEIPYGNDFIKRITSMACEYNAN